MNVNKLHYWFHLWEDVEKPTVIVAVTASQFLRLIFNMLHIKTRTTYENVSPVKIIGESGSGVSVRKQLSSWSKGCKLCTQHMLQLFKFYFLTIMKKR